MNRPCVGIRHPITCTLSPAKVLREHNDLSILASFPGETWDEQAVYVRRQGEPAFILLWETRWHEAVSAALIRLAARLPALAERWGSPLDRALGRVAASLLSCSHFPELASAVRACSA
jgi:hypothetical protein